MALPTETIENLDTHTRVGPRAWTLLYNTTRWMISSFLARRDPQAEPTSKTITITIGPGLIAIASTPDVVKRLVDQTDGNGVTETPQG